MPFTLRPFAILECTVTRILTVSSTCHFLLLDACFSTTPFVPRELGIGVLLIKATPSKEEF